MQLAKASYDRKATPQAEEGDELFLGFNSLLEPDKLPPGVLAAVVNGRMRNGQVEPRKGVVKLAWLNVLNPGVDNTVRPVGQFYGGGTFQDPSSVEWVLTAADGLIFRHRPHNARFALDLPTGVKILSPVSFVQAFNKVYCFRGRHLAPLVLADIDDGFEDILPHWDSGATYAANDEVAYGPFQAVSSLTSSGDKATVVTAAEHGYVTGADITISGAVETAYNGRFNITVIDNVTFTYHFTGATSPATGTITCSNMGQYWKAGGGGGSPSAGDSPDSAPTKWTQIFNVLPNADDALYINNRLLVPTAYTPGDTDYDASSSYTKKDFIVATDILDDVHFDFSNEFRINQGSDDEIVCLVKYGPDTAIVIKGKSWGVLSNIAVDLTNLTLDMHTDGYGGCALRSAIVAGKNVFFPATKRGIVSIAQNLQGQLRSVDIPFSNDIAKEINRINWNYADKIRLAYWDDKLYCAVPLDDAQVTNQNIVVVSGAGTGAANTFYYKESETFYSDGDVNTIAFNGDDDLWHIYLDGSDAYTAPALTGPWSLVPGSGISKAPVPSSEFYALSQTCNAILVYDFRAGENGMWQSVDTGEAIFPMEWFKANYCGVERLFYLASDGFVNLMEEAEGGDQVRASADSLTLLKFTPVETSYTTRGYKFTTEAQKRFKNLQLVLGVWDAQFSVSLSTGAAFVAQDRLTDVSFSRFDYIRPFDRAPYVDGNVNDDFATPGRGNYAVYLGSGLSCGSNGVPMGIHQEITRRVSIPNLAGRYAQVQVTNNQGRCVLKSVVPVASEGQRRGGNLV